MSSDLDEISLLRWLNANIGNVGEALTIEKFPGGQSNPTYRLETPRGQMVLRRKPFGKLLPSAHAIDREFRILSALHPTGFPVPRPIRLCEDETVIGAMFYLMEMVDGRVFTDGTLPGCAPQERSAIYRNYVATLARLHAIDFRAVGLADFERPGNYLERQVGRWTKQYRVTQTDDIPEVEKVLEWLARTAPPQQGNATIHGDYKLNNGVFAKSGGEVLAVLDWELATVGDPLADLSYLLMFWIMPPEEPASLAAVDFAATGIPSMEEAIAEYCRVAGRQEMPDLDWYFAFNLFRLLGIFQGVKKRMLDGNASSDKAGEIAALIPLLADAAWTRARMAGAV